MEALPGMKGSPLGMVEVEGVGVEVEDVKVRGVEVEVVEVRGVEVESVELEGVEVEGVKGSPCGIVNPSGTTSVNEELQRKSLTGVPE